MTGACMKINQGRVKTEVPKNQIFFSEVSPQSPCTYSKITGEKI